VLILNTLSGLFLKQMDRPSSSSSNAVTVANSAISPYPSYMTRKESAQREPWLVSTPNYWKPATSASAMKA
jgi:hypothetical protein